MKADILLSRLDKVRKTGRDSWIACCPAHDDRSPSMTIRELDDGRILVHCFAECSVESILGAVGLGFDALFPDRAPQHQQAKPLRRPFPASDVLEAVTIEAEVVATAAGNMAQGVALTSADRERLTVAAGRIQRARELANG